MNTDRRMQNERLGLIYKQLDQLRTHSEKCRKHVDKFGQFGPGHERFATLESCAEAQQIVAAAEAALADAINVETAAMQVVQQLLLYRDAALTVQIQECYV